MEENTTWEHAGAWCNEEEYDDDLLQNSLIDLKEVRETDLLLKKEMDVLKQLQDVDTNMAWEKIKKRRLMGKKNHWIQKIGSFVAAAIIIFISGYYLAQLKTEKTENRMGSHTYTIPYAEMGSVVLSDGTTVFLNSGSSLKCPVNFSSPREVYLTGEAYFEVSSDKKNPFLVHLNGINIKVTGTKFNISSYPHTNPEMTLLEGKITVLNNNNSKILEMHPNESVIYNRESRKLYRNKVDASQKIRWKEGKIFLRNKTLEEISMTLERWYNVEIKFDNQALKQVRITGTILKNKPIEQILKVLELSEPIDFNYTYENHVLKKITVNKEKKGID